MSSVQVRMSEPNHRAVTILASSWGVTRQEAVDRIIECFLVADLKVQALLKAAKAAGEDGTK